MKNIYLFMIASLLFSCGSDDDATDEPTNEEETVATTEYYISSQMDGQTVLFDQTDGYDLVVSNGGSWSEICIYDYGSGLYNYDEEDQPQMNIEFQQHLVLSDCNEEENFQDSFSPDTYTYAEGDNQGITVNYSVDENHIYSSRIGDQTGSTFTVTEREFIPPSTFVTSMEMKLKGTFSCNLYNTLDASDVKEVTDGEFSLSFRSQN